MAGPIRAFLDTNVLYGNPSLDILLSMSDAPYRLLTPLWNEHVFMELGHHLPERLKDLDRREGIELSDTEASRKARRRLTMMRRAFPDAMVVMDPLEDYPDSLTYDPDDKAIAVGAISSEADVLVTENLKHFNVPAIRAFHPLIVQNEADFLMERFRENPSLMREALIDMCDRHELPPRSLRELTFMMRRQTELASFADLLESDVRDRYRRAIGSMFHTSQSGQGRDRLGRFTASVHGMDSDLEPPGDWWGPFGNGPDI
ncbi:PIN domain-containing protein [Bifidobacterium sp. SO1]|uniref:PIN domain-containing protein n=1 Tax=Bifidobacterium sp. SO1 TaxID=2809029 RepID=UPI001BDC80D7|nr:PIN domain-containing protein [Bifidobacterium sp. SO1]MBT1161695.1 PIN domain-containing protein [Bifidobacterium sp. SO1]